MTSPTAENAEGPDLTTVKSGTLDDSTTAVAVADCTSVVLPSRVKLKLACAVFA